MYLALTATGGFIGGFLACWFLAAGIKTEIAKLRADLSVILSNVSKKI